MVILTYCVGLRPLGNDLHLAGAGAPLGYFSLAGKVTKRALKGLAPPENPSFLFLFCAHPLVGWV